MQYCTWQHSHTSNEDCNHKNKEKVCQGEGPVKLFLYMPIAYTWEMECTLRKESK